MQCRVHYSVVDTVVPPRVGVNEDHSPFLDPQLSLFLFYFLFVVPALFVFFPTFQRLFFRGGELRNPHTLQDCGIYRDGQTVYLASSPQDEMGKPYSLEPFLGAGALPRSLARVLGQVGFPCGVTDGVGCAPALT